MPRSSTRACPKVTGDLTVSAKPVAITGLGDQDGNLVAVTATVDLDISAAAATEKAAPLHIVRTGSFVLSPDLGRHVEGVAPTR